MYNHINEVLTTGVVDSNCMHIRGVKVKWLEWRLSENSEHWEQLQDWIDAMMIQDIQLTR